ncbi:hypothetical protein AOQ84DRAFT_29028 [Glonium stellatum]|uniref:Uncharacterized protein n=1 Tax=Glonium stellatum TaxID=574774 RepID=A0A8E2F2S2_9PEZI|nr:hypothetical protein AOQ84DRAFT_29028 [Glonium stellatum]
MLAEGISTCQSLAAFPSEKPNKMIFTKYCVQIILQRKHFSSSNKAGAMMLVDP